MTIKFFPSPADFRDWLEQHHKQEPELWVGYYKKATGIPSIDWSESVDQALCYGWIDGLRKSIDEKSYKIRFTPRRASSNWSEVNIKKVNTLIQSGQMHPAGLAAFEKRKKSKSTDKQKIIELSPTYSKLLKANPKAWSYFQALSPSIQKQCIGWIMSAKQETTRLKRLNVLITSSQAQEKIPPLRISKK